MFRRAPILVRFPFLLAVGCDRNKSEVSAAPSVPPKAPVPTASTTPQPSASAAPSAEPVQTVEAPADAGMDASPPEPDPRLPSAGKNSGSTAEHTRDGKLFIAGQDRHARHTHGGDAAHIGNVTFVVTNDSDRPRKITAQGVEFLHDSSCEKPAATLRSKPKLGSIIFDDDEDYRAATATLSVPPKTSKAVNVNFEPVSAYMVWCDRFAIRVRFSVDGKETLAPVADLRVIRVQPLRH